MTSLPFNHGCIPAQDSSGASRDFPALIRSSSRRTRSSSVGLDVTEMGLDLIEATLPILTRVRAGPLASGQPLLTSTDLQRLQKALTHADGLLTDVEGQLGGLDLSQLSLTAAQLATFNSLREQLPHIHDTLRQANQWLPPIAWMLGVGQPRHFLVQTLDRAELRPSGGFTGDYGVLTLTNGKLEPFSLYNVNDIDYGLKTNGWIFGRRPPAQYSWWPFANWGLRDANLSPDFPTTAKIIMRCLPQRRWWRCRWRDPRLAGRHLPCAHGHRPDLCA